MWPWCFKIYRPSKIFTGPGLLAVVFHKPWLWPVFSCRQQAAVWHSGRLPGWMAGVEGRQQGICLSPLQESQPGQERRHRPGDLRQAPQRHQWVQSLRMLGLDQIRSDWPQIGQIWDFLRPVSVHIDLSNLELFWPNLMQPWYICNIINRW